MCVCVCLFLSVKILGCLVVFMSIYTVCNFSACEIIKHSESESESESESDPTRQPRTPGLDVPAPGRHCE